MFKLAARVTSFLSVIGVLILPSSAVAGACICLACAFDSKIENFRAVGSAMAPTIEIDDCALMQHIDPLSHPIGRGDVVGYKPQPNSPIHIARVVAQAGDRIAIHQGQIILNGTPVPQSFVEYDDILYPQKPPFPICAAPTEPGQICRRSKLKETLPKKVSYEILDIRHTRFDEMDEVTVPPLHVFLMGDNRDNSNDSRVSPKQGGPGFVALESIAGIFDALTPR